MATFKIIGSDEHDMTIVITIDGKELSYEQVGQLYNEACDSDSDDAAELEDILDRADRILRNAQEVARYQRVAAFYRDNPDHECDESDPVIRHW